eukprot:782299-Pelagomonas_calceolata.AAC.2
MQLGSCADVSPWGLRYSFALTLPMLVRRDNAMQGLGLQGHVVPVLDIRRLCSAGPYSARACASCGQEELCKAFFCEGVHCLCSTERVSAPCAGQAEICFL